MWFLAKNINEGVFQSIIIIFIFYLKFFMFYHLSCQISIFID